MDYQLADPYLTAWNKALKARSWHCQKGLVRNWY